MLSFSEKQIVLLKRPAWLNETRTYPLLPPFKEVKKIILVRDVYNTVVSARKIILWKFSDIFKSFGCRYLAENYWTQVTENLLKLKNTDNTTFVRYEDILENPVKQTKLLFEFIGSCQKEGISRYSSPKNYKWTWGKDDWGDKINSLEVQNPSKITAINNSLNEIINNSQRIINLRQKLNYC